MAKVGITIDRRLLDRVDRLVKSHRFPNRSTAIQEAVAEKLAQLEHGRLARERARLDRTSEQTAAEQGMSDEPVEWADY